jgi:hypothetical protein
MHWLSCLFVLPHHYCSRRRSDLSCLCSCSTFIVVAIISCLVSAIHKLFRVTCALVCHQSIVFSRLLSQSGSSSCCQTAAATSSSVCWALSTLLSGYTRQKGDWPRALAVPWMAGAGTHLGEGAHMHITCNSCHCTFSRLYSTVAQRCDAC